MIVDDDRVGQKSIRRAFAENQFEHRLSVALNGREALDLLERRFCGGGPGGSRPALILLDLNMPLMNGFEFLEAIKRDRVLGTIPVVILTTSNRSEDRDQSYRLGAAGYIVKPDGFREYCEVVRTINEYWCVCRVRGG